MVTTAVLRRAVSFSTAAMMACFGLTGVVSAQTISNTGPGSTNTITSTTTSNCTVTNNNNVSANSSNRQSATTGGTTSDGNTSVGLPWTGWNGLDPLAAQANGQSYASWQSGVLDWVSQRASGDGWNSNNSNLSWTPSGSDWASFDPMVWQAAGQSFGNWYNSVASYLNNNSTTWILSWPSDASSGDGLGGTSTGDAANNNNVSFSISINNTARTAAGTNSCGQSNFTPPAGNGMGAGPAAPVYVSPAASGYTPHYTARGSGLGGGSYYYRPASTSYHAPAAQPVSAPAPAVSAPTPPPVVPVVPPSTPAAVNSISNTGPKSTNTISSSTSSNYQVTNNNNVSAASTSSQTASTGDSTANGNTSVGGSGTGDASNGNSAGTGVGVSN